MAENDETLRDGVKCAFYRVDGYATWIPGVCENTKQAFYMACKECKKKVTEEFNGF